jgi:hypothetical protein
MDSNKDGAVDAAELRDWIKNEALFQITHDFDKKRVAAKQADILKRLDKNAGTCLSPCASRSLELMLSCLARVQTPKCPSRSSPSSSGALPPFVVSHAFKSRSRSVWTLREVRSVTESLLQRSRSTKGGADGAKAALVVVEVKEQTKETKSA